VEAIDLESMQDAKTLRLEGITNSAQTKFYEPETQLSMKIEQRN
jgi:hypothetical protein